MSKSVAFISLCLATLVSVHAAAQTTYRSTMPGGRVIYADKPVPGAAKTVETAPPMPTSGIGGTVLRMPISKERSSQEPGTAASRGKGETSRVTLEAAEEALRKAELARREGAEPTDVDRIGSVGGGARLRDSYWERQSKLEEEVTKAKQTLDEVRLKQ
ncbi:MAG: DUF4124 domain-containing protein [Betaproteobacteria bacterium]|nr:DUF4124 domain-containing protein [Betaproteobacteria bacterium]